MKTLEQLEQMLGADLLRELPALAEDAGTREDDGIRRAFAPDEKKSEVRVLSVEVMSDKAADKLIGNVWLLADADTEYVIMQIEMLENGVVIAKNTFADIKPETVDLHVIGTPVGPVSEDNIKMRVSVLNKAKNVPMHMLEETYPVTYFLGADEAVDHIDVIDPRNINTPEGSTIHVSFDRKSQLGQSVDYDYTDKLSPTSKQPVYLDMNGRIILNDGYTYVNGSYKTEQIFLRKGDRFYQYKNGEARISYDSGQNTISYAYGNEWNEAFPKNVEGTNAKADYRLLATFRYTDTNTGKTKTSTVIVSSKAYENLSQGNSAPHNYQKIPDILFYWGCVEENTFITMEDGSKRKVKDIHIGEKVRAVNGEICTVGDILRGTEQRLFCITSAGKKEILVTEDHPFVTRKGGKPAIALCYEDELLMEDGSYERIDGAFPVEKEFVVYSLVVTPSAYIYGNGFAVGDWENQSKAMEELRAKKEISVSEQIAQECETINMKLHQVYERS